MKHSEKQKRTVPAKPKRKRRPRDYKFDMDSGNIVYRAHGGSGKPISDV